MVVKNGENGLADQSDLETPKSFLKMIDSLKLKNKKKRNSAANDVCSYLWKKQQVDSSLIIINVFKYRQYFIKFLIIK